MFLGKCGRGLYFLEVPRNHLECLGEYLRGFGLYELIGSLRGSCGRELCAYVDVQEFRNVSISNTHALNF